MTQFVEAKQILHVDVEIDQGMIDMLLKGKRVWITRNVDSSLEKVVVSIYSSDHVDEDEVDQ